MKILNWAPNHKAGTQSGQGIGFGRKYFKKSPNKNHTSLGMYNNINKEVLGTRFNNFESIITEHGVFFFNKFGAF